MTDYQRFDELVSSAVRASSVINKVDILKNALDLYHGKVLSSADGEHWLIQFSTKYHLSYMGTVSELLKQLDSLHSYDLLNQYAMKSLTIAPDNPKAYGWLIRSLKAQGMNADLYDSASFEAKKMIVSQLIRRVDVYRGYQIHVDFNFDLAQYLEISNEIAC